MKSTGKVYAMKAMNKNQIMEYILVLSNEQKTSV